MYVRPILLRSIDAGCGVLIHCSLPLPVLPSPCRYESLLASINKMTVEELVMAVRWVGGRRTGS